jgi:hypothetical protein
MWRVFFIHTNMPYQYGTFQPPGPYVEEVFRDTTEPLVTTGDPETSNRHGL